MHAPDFHAAAAFVAANARVLDRRRFQRLFGDGPASAVRDAVAATGMIAGTLHARPRSRVSIWLPLAGRIRASGSP